MRAKTRQILEECIETGVIHGYARAFKHTDRPKEIYIKECIQDAIWFEIDDKFEFDRDLVSEVMEGFDNLV